MTPGNDDKRDIIIFSPKPVNASLHVSVICILSLVPSVNQPLWPPFEPVKFKSPGPGKIQENFK